ncbi:MAG: vWA domain-containing protein [Candidatus Nanopelagicales bacterium]
MTRLHADWQETAASISRLAHDITGHPVTTRIYPPGAVQILADPMIYRVPSRRLFVDATAVGMSAESCGLLVDSAVDRLRHPVIAGLVISALAPAIDSPWRTRLPADCDTRELAAAEMLDQIRGEARLASHDVVAQTVVRAAAAKIVDLSGDRSLRELITVLVGELLPRTDGLIFPMAAAHTARQVVDSTIGTAGLRRFVTLWRKAFRLDSNDAGAWLMLGAQWVAALDICNLDVGGQPDPSISAAIRAEIEGVTVAARGDAALMVEIFDNASDAAPSSFHDQLVNRSPPNGIPGAGIGLPQHRNIRYSNPTADDIRARDEFRRHMLDAGHRSPGHTTVPVPYPSGRLHSRDLVRRTAQMSLGLQVTAMPWRRNLPAPHVSVKLTFAMVIDTSLTMSLWASHAAPLGWAIASGVHQLGGTCAVWGFGGEAFQVLKAGTAPKLVPTVADSGSGSDGCGDALDQAAAETGLFHRDGARVAVVLTDGKLPRQDWESIAMAVDRLHRVGVTVLWVLPHSRGDADFIPPGATVLTQVRPDTFVSAVGSTLLGALRSA